MNQKIFAPPAAPEQQELGPVLRPKFNADGLVTCVTVDAEGGAVLMVAHMDATALEKTLATGEAHYWSRSRQALWRKGETSGSVQKVVGAAVDCDQDAILLHVRVGGDGATCHTGRRSCFYRRITAPESTARPDPTKPALEFIEE